ncbi:hypothetical protein QW131_30985 [Roseibium salinum]|nr:hypothetical protein [Roseibium salinum]
MTAPLNRLLATLAVVAALGGTAMAQDDALYPEPSAPDASYLRILTDAGTETEIDGNAAEAGEAGLTRYYEVSPGEVELRIAGRTISVQPGANAHYTYVAAGDQGELMSDEITDSPANADLVFYNLTDLDGVEVYVPEAEAVALEGVGPLKNRFGGTSGSDDARLRHSQRRGRTRQYGGCRIAPRNCDKPGTSLRWRCLSGKRRHKHLCPVTATELGRSARIMRLPLAYRSAVVSAVLALAVSLPAPARAAPLEVTFEPPDIPRRAICEPRPPRHELIARWQDWSGKQLDDRSTALISAGPAALAVDRCRTVVRHGLNGV